MKKHALIILTIICSSSLSAQYATQITVDQSGHGDFTSIQEAINATKAFPEKDITIYIKNGTYREKVTIYAWNNRLSLIGESKLGTKIIWDDHFSQINLGRNSTFHTYTLKVEANDVTLKNLTITNDAGPVGQAVALHLTGDRIKVLNCQIHGNQDTLYVAGEGLRQYFKGCSISGTTDFIFGAATAVFDSCIIVSKSNSYVTAASTPKTSPFGLVFMNCDIIKLEFQPNMVDQVYLGRPWRSYAKTAFINCYLDDHIAPAGWDNWGSVEKEATVTYIEYGSKGPGAKDSDRVKWSRTLTKKEAASYTLSNIFGNWIPD
ncbi:pectinesterase family protein [Marinoscillum sp.]|uniref:pectinesterase family protein n=1 Tax=Marinoscillum sp. TaxID=2024838 RepID=UPI003BAA8AF6